MNPEFRRVKEVFLAALEREGRAEREACLREACGSDGALRRQVEALLGRHEQAGSFLESPAPELDPTRDLPGVAERPGAVVGPYKLLEPIGEGAFGAVFLAEQTHPVRRKVALKVLKAGMDTKQVVARFEAERQALALMDHPHIARVFDGGQTPSGRPYFVMELVRGVPVTEFCDQNRLPPRERLRLFVQVCRAVQHAHQKGVIHRDLKPSNVLVTVHDTTPVVKVIDFGVAKAVGQQLTEQTLFTGFAQMVGTPLYMSPEQAGQSGLDVDTRSDIYSLGVLLYELLTGSTPFPKERFQKAAYEEIRRIIREEEPPRPSTRLSESKETLLSISAQRHTEPAKLTRLVRGELDWIVMKALEKDRSRRYETANGFAMDIERYLHDQPVQACPPSAGYRLRKFVRRNKRPVLAAVLVFATLVGGIVGTTWQAVRATGARDAEALERQRAVGAEKLAEDRAEALERSLYFQCIARADLELAAGNVGRAAHILEACPSKHRHWEWHYLNRLCHAELFALNGHTDKVRSVAFSPDGRWLASAGHDRTVRLWDLTTGQVVRVLRGHQLQINSVVFSPDSRLLASASGEWLAGRHGELKLWDVATGTEQFGTQPHRGVISEVAFTPDGRHLVTSGWDSTVRVHDAVTGELLNILASKANTLKCVAVSPDGKLIAAGSHDRRIVLWETATGAEVGQLRGHQGDVMTVAFSPDSRRLVSSGYDQVVKLWDVRTETEERSFWEHTALVYRVAFSPDGQRIASASTDGSVRIWDPETESSVRVIRGHDGDVFCVAFSPGGSCLATGGWDQTVKVWDAITEPAVRFLMPQPSGRLHQLRGFAISPDGNLLAAACDNPATYWDPGRVFVWDAATHRLVREFGEHAGGVRGVAFSPDGSRLAADSGQVVKLWDPRTGKELAALEGHTAPVSGVAFSPNGRHLASAGEDGAILLWDLTAEKPSLAGTFRGHQGPVHCVAFSPDGRQVASGGADNTVRTWDVDTGQAIRTVAEHKGPVTCVAFSPNGDRLASASEDRTARVWETSTGLALVLRGHVGPVQSVAFSHDGLRLATGGAEGSICVWDAATGQEALALRRQAFVSRVVAFTPGDRALASCGRRFRDQAFAIMFWDAAEAGSDTPQSKILAWHAREAEGLEKLRQLPAALFHLDRLIAAKPQDASLPARRERALQGAGESQRTVAGQAKTTPIKTDPAKVHLERAQINSAGGSGTRPPPSSPGYSS